MQVKEALSILNIDSPEGAEKAYFAMAANMHPDEIPKTASDNYKQWVTERFRLVNEAYGILMGLRYMPKKPEVCSSPNCGEGLFIIDGEKYVSQGDKCYHFNCAQTLPEWRDVLKRHFYKT